MNVKDLLRAIIASIVDDEDSINILESTDEKGLLLEVQVGAGDVGKVIGKKGRIANAARTIVKAAGAKQSVRVMVNISKTPIAPAAESLTVGVADATEGEA